MKLKFRHLALAAATLMAIATGVSSQDYPSRPVKIVVGYVPGGGPDFVARTFGQKLSEILGQHGRVRAVDPGCECIDEDAAGLDP